jgi:predicted esterase
LQRAGYRSHYREFPGGHEVPEVVAAEALAFLTAG